MFASERSAQVAHLATMLHRNDLMRGKFAGDSPECIGQYTSAEPWVEDAHKLLLASEAAVASEEAKQPPDPELVAAVEGVLHYAESPGADLMGFPGGRAALAALKAALTPAKERSAALRRVVECATTVDDDEWAYPPDREDNERLRVKLLDLSSALAALKKLEG